MRILHCISDLSNGGAQRQLVYLSAQQVRQGLEVHVAFLHAGPNLRGVEQSGAQVHRLHSRGNHDPYLLWQLCRLITRSRPNVVQTWINQMDVLGGIAARLMRVPWVLSERCSALNYPRTLKNWLRTRVGAGASAVVSNSHGGDEYWRQRVRRSVRRRVIANALPLEEIAEIKPASSLPTQVGPETLMAVHVGRLCPQKNLECLIPALEMVSSRLPLVTFFLGDGTHAQTAERLIACHGLGNKVMLTGYRSDVWSWMKRAQVFISVSLFEGHPNAVLEAAACGCPLVLSDIPAHREMLDERAAFLVDPASPADIADGITRCLTQPEEARRRAQVAQAHVHHLSVPQMARRYEEVYLELQPGFLTKDHTCVASWASQRTQPAPRTIP